MFKEDGNQYTDEYLAYLIENGHTIDGKEVTKRMLIEMQRVVEYDKWIDENFTEAEQNFMDMVEKEFKKEGLK